MLDNKSIERNTNDIINAVPKSGWKLINRTVPKMREIKIPLLKFFDNRFATKTTIMSKC